MSLYLTNVSITVTDSMAEKKKEFECVELGDLQQKAECGEKAPRRVIHFSSGETMEEYSTEDEEDHTHTQPDKNNLLSSVDTSNMTWGPYVWFQMWRAATNTVSACDYVGERMASLFGITSAKYQYAIDEYNRTNKQKKYEAKESPASEEAESHFKEKQMVQEQNFAETKVDDLTETPPEAESLDAESPLEAVTLDAETTPEAVTLDTETTPEAVTLDTETTPEAVTLDTETTPEAVTLDTKTTPEAVTLDTETTPEAVTLDAETTPEAVTLDTKTTPEAVTLDAETPPEAESLDAETRPEA